MRRTSSGTRRSRPVRNLDPAIKRLASDRKGSKPTETFLALGRSDAICSRRRHQFLDEGAPPACAARDAIRPQAGGAPSPRNRSSNSKGRQNLHQTTMLWLPATSSAGRSWAVMIISDFAADEEGSQQGQAQPDVATDELNRPREDGTSSAPTKPVC